MFQELHLELITMDCLNLNIYSPSDYQHRFQQFQMKPLPQVKEEESKNQRIKESKKNQRIKEFIFPTGLQFPHWININLATFSQQHVHLKIFSFVAQYTLVLTELSEGYVSPRWGGCTHRIRPDLGTLLLVLVTLHVIWDWWRYFMILDWIQQRTKGAARGWGEGGWDWLKRS